MTIIGTIIISLLIILGVKFYQENKEDEKIKIKEAKEKLDFHNSMLSLVIKYLELFNLSIEYNKPQNRKSSGEFSVGQYIPAGKIFRFQRINLIIETYEFNPRFLLLIKALHKPL
jgi:hypothetical protein